MRLLLFTVGCALCVSLAQAQTWSELQAVPQNSTVRVFELGGKGWAFADGRLLLVKDGELTIVRSGKPLVIPRATIARVDKRCRDSPVEGAIIGALVGIAAMSAGGGQGCNSSGAACTGGFMLTYALLGTFVDWQIVGQRTVYKAP
jgi:hypothetical protein